MDNNSNNSYNNNNGQNNGYNNGYNNGNMNYSYRPRDNRSKTLTTFASLSMTLGIVSFFMATTIIIPIALGSLSIILAVLSKGTDLKMKGPSLIGFASSVAAIICAFLLGAVEIYAFFNIESYHNQMNAMYKEFYGITMDEYITNVFGEDISFFEN